MTLRSFTRGWTLTKESYQRYLKLLMGTGRKIVIFQMTLIPAQLRLRTDSIDQVTSRQFEHCSFFSHSPPRHHPPSNLPREWWKSGASDLGPIKVLAALSSLCRATWVRPLPTLSVVPRSRSPGVTLPSTRVSTSINDLASTRNPTSRLCLCSLTWYRAPYHAQRR